jgi:predicted PurR-regulated permease PerM
VAANRPNPPTGNTTLLSVVMVVAALYFAREVFIPLALSVLFAFLLAPLVVRLRHWHFGRSASVLTVVVFAFAVVAVIGALVVFQLSDLGRQLPQYQQNIQKKVHAIRDSSNGLTVRLTRLMQDFGGESGGGQSTNDTRRAQSGAAQDGQNNPNKPIPVEIHNTRLAPLEIIQKILGSLLGMVLTAVIVVVFVIFMLLQREDLRDRFIRLLGSRRLNVTTRALDEAGDRVSRYLLALLAVNTVYGVLAGIGLYFMGIPNPILWGVLAALFRYIPYLGIWVAAAMPAAVAFAVADGWMKPAGIFGLYVGIDLCAYNLVEPLLYGSSTGMTPLAILVAAVFWTWLWGPVGLLLSTPLTVCVAVIGRYAPSFRFLGVLLSDEPVLSPDKRFYQRLLAMNLEEATEVAETFLKGKSLEELYEEVMVPALRLAEQDRFDQKLDADQEHFLYENLRLLVEDLAERSPELVAGDNGKARRAEREAAPPQSAPPPVVVLVLPARDPADEIACLMLTKVLQLRGIGARNISAEALASERLDEIGRSKVHVACVCAVPPDGWLAARYLCKRLGTEFPDVQLVAAVLVSGGADQLKKREPAMPAAEVTTDIKATVTAIISYLPGDTIARREPSAFSA